MVSDETSPLKDRRYSHKFWPCMPQKLSHGKYEYIPIIIHQKYFNIKTLYFFLYCAMAQLKILFG